MIILLLQLSSLGLVGKICSITSGPPLATTKIHVWTYILNYMIRNPGVIFFSTTWLIGLTGHSALHSINLQETGNKMSPEVCSVCLNLSKYVDAFLPFLLKISLYFPSTPLFSSCAACSCCSLTGCFQISPDMYFRIKMWDATCKCIACQLVQPINIFI